MNRRLLQFLNAEKISQSQFADSIGVARASITHIISGRNKPGFDFIVNTTKRYPDLNIEWLLTGDGRMYKDKSGTKNSNSVSQDDSKPASRKVAESSVSNQESLFPQSDNNGTSESQTPLLEPDNAHEQLFAVEDKAGIFPSSSRSDDDSADTYSTGSFARPSPFRKAAHFSGTKRPADIPAPTVSKTSTAAQLVQLPAQKNVAKVLILFSDGSFQELR